MRHERARRKLPITGKAAIALRPRDAIRGIA
jgi:hypothetical protein